jgi:hypothetical protein
MFTTTGLSVPERDRGLRFTEASSSGLLIDGSPPAPQLPVQLLDVGAYGPVVRLRHRADQSTRDPEMGRARFRHGRWAAWQRSAEPVARRDPGQPRTSSWRAAGGGGFRVRGRRRRRRARGRNGCRPSVVSRPCRSRGWFAPCRPRRSISGRRGGVRSSDCIVPARCWSDRTRWRP